MRKVLITTDSYLPRLDGVSIFLSEIVGKLSHKFAVTLIAPGYEDRPIDNMHIKKVFIPTFRFKIGEFELAKIRLKEIKRQVKECDILFNQSVGTIGYFASRYAYRMKKPIIGFVHSIEHIRAPLYIKRFRRLSYWILKKIEKGYFDNCHLLLVPSQEVIDSLRELGVKTKMVRVNLGVDIERSCPPNSKDMAKKRIGIEPHTKVIGYVGRVSREKNLTVLYDAFSRIREKREDVKLLIVGSGLRKEFFPDTKNIIFINSVRNVEDYYKAMDVFVLPSLVETTSLATKEAMSCGVPAITTKVGTIPDYLKHGINGYFFHKEHDSMLAEKIMEILSNQSLASRMSKNARKTMVEDYSWNNTVSEIEKALLEP